MVFRMVAIGGAEGSSRSDGGQMAVSGGGDKGRSINLPSRAVEDERGERKGETGEKGSGDGRSALFAEFIV